jgi:multisubunit Na+/H+ antiporter MnhE subunit
VIGTLVRAAGLAVVYLLVLTSTDPGDVLVGIALGLGLALGLRPRRPSGHGAPWFERLAAAAVVALQTAVEMVRGSWRVVLFCLGGRPGPGFVEIPREARSRHETALWGVLTGEAPDEVPVDAGRDALVVHLVDARDPDAVRARHAAAHERWQRKVVR